MTLDAKAMRKTPFYSVRTGRHKQGGNFDLPMLKKLFMVIYGDFDNRGYLAQYYGYDCVDVEDHIPGILGEDIAGQCLLHVKKDLWPIYKKIDDYDEDDMFDVIEFTFDTISKPLQGEMHSWGGCGMHWSKFDQPPGQAEYREKMNGILEAYGSGFELNERGEVLALADRGLDPLFVAPVPTSDREGVQERVEAAIAKFRRHRSSLEDRRNAVRDLADVLERLRPKLKTILTSKDEADLFNIANNFGIRHNNENQKTQYDQSIWLSWMFYYYLSTIHACTRLIERSKSRSSTASKGSAG